MSGIELEPDRRGLERRVEMLEHEVKELEKQIAVMQVTLDKIESTMESRHKAFERGQDLILRDLEIVKGMQRKQETDLATLASAPQDLSKATLSTRMIAGIIVTIAMIIAGQQASTWGMRSDIQAIGAKQVQQEATAKLTEQLKDERAAMLKTTADDIKKKQDLYQLEIQSLRETILNQRRSQ